MQYHGQAVVNGLQLVWSGPWLFDFDVRYGLVKPLPGICNAYYFPGMVSPLGVIDGDRAIWGTLWK